ncbi:MAG TPA: group 1 truncated hemoglobin, partial [Ignavibacteria bacterium]|nr:group 1 truncated hemoglobin [Ignavibacteria bacterium]
YDVLKADYINYPISILKGENIMKKFTGILIPAAIFAVLLMQSCSDDTTMNNTTTTQTLYTRLGGSTAIDTVVAVFIGNVAADNQINFFFAPVLADSSGSRYRLLRQNLSQQICMVTGGPCLYMGRDMRTAHNGMSITTAQFNALVNDLVMAMTTLSVPQAEQNELLAILGPLCHDIVDNGNGTGCP